MHVDAPRSNITHGSPQSHSDIVPLLAIEFWSAVVSHRIASEIISASHLSTFHAPDKRKRYYYPHTVYMPVRLPRSAGIQQYIRRHGIGKHTVHCIGKPCATAIHERQTTTSQAQKAISFPPADFRARPRQACVILTNEPSVTSRHH